MFPGKRTIPAPTGTTSEGVEARTSGVEVALDPSELELEPEAVAARYERHLREQRPGKAPEDLSDMLADHVARQKVINNFNLSSTIINLIKDRKYQMTQC